MAWHELQHSQAGECEWMSVLVWMTHCDYFKLLHRVRTPGCPLLCRWDFLPETQISWYNSLAEYFSFDFVVPIGWSPKSFVCHSNIFFFFLLKMAPSYLSSLIFLSSSPLSSHILVIATYSPGFYAYAIPSNWDFSHPFLLGNLLFILPSVNSSVM